MPQGRERGRDQLRKEQLEANHTMSQINTLAISSSNSSAALAASKQSTHRFSIFVYKPGNYEAFNKHLIHKALCQSFISLST